METATVVRHEIGRMASPRMVTIRAVMNLTTRILLMGTMARRTDSPQTSATKS
jgi:hypothetical protein